MAISNKTNAQIEQDRTAQIMNIVAERAGFYRENLDIFCRDYLQITNLKWFQKIIIWAMIHNYYIMAIASRGIGKTFLCSVYLVVRAILFPGSKIIVVSGTRKQGNEVLLKIQDELMPKSTLLKNELYESTSKEVFLNPRLFFNGELILGPEFEIGDMLVVRNECSIEGLEVEISVNRSELTPMKSILFIINRMNSFNIFSFCSQSEIGPISGILRIHQTH